MTIAELKRLKDVRPFQPFVMRTADGRDIQIRHPDAIAWDQNARRVVLCIVPGGSHVSVDVSLVTTVEPIAQGPGGDNGNTSQETH